MNYIDLLKNNKNIRILAFTQLIIFFGAWFSQTGVFTLLIKLDAPTWAISTSAFLAYLPGIVLAPIAGVIIEKNKPKKLLMITASIEFVSIFALIFINSLVLIWLLFILVFIRLCAALLYFQTQMSLFARILNPDELKLANELHSIIWGFSYAFGMAMAGLFIHFFDTTAAFLFSSILLAFSIGLLSFLRIKDFAQNATSKTFLMIKEGILYLFSNKVLLHLVILHSFMGLTAYETILTLLAKHPYKEVLSASLVIGSLNAIRALAIVLGPVFLSRFVKVSNLGLIYLGQGLGIIIWGLMQFNFYISALGILAAGFFTSTLWSFTYTLMQKQCDKAFLGRTIAYVELIYLSFSILVSALSGALFELGLNLSLITILLGLCFVLASFYWNWFYKKYMK